jgi:tetratricopeptide (TPR) repeat protein
VSLNKSLETGMQHQLAGRHSQAAAIYLEILKSEPSQPDANHLLGLVRMEQERDQEAVLLMEKALALCPTAAHFHHNIAGLYRRMGRLGEAETRFREAIRLKADYGEAYQGLAEMITFKAGDPLIQKVDEQVKRKELDRRLRSYFHFTAGKMLDDIGRYRDAFAHYTQGNTLANRKFDSRQFRALVKDILYVSGPSQARRAEGSGNSSEIPTFIVGMPRSGTTLMEQILASHSKVFGAGELNDMRRIAASTRQLSRLKVDYPNTIPGLQNTDYTILAAEYLKRIEALVDDKSVTRIVDKHPLNFQFIGLICSMFPNAKIIHTVRNPLDTCLSCFFQNFTKGQDYSFELRALGYFYNNYRRLMEHWESVYPGRIYSVRYEDLLSGQENETRRLLDFLGLNFEQQCLDFHQTERKVSTASFLQVRKPLYGTSEKRWMNYRAELAELARIIGIKTDAPVTISGQNSILT